MHTHSFGNHFSVERLASLSVRLAEALITVSRLRWSVERSFVSKFVMLIVVDCILFCGIGINKVVLTRYRESLNVKLCVRKNTQQISRMEHYTDIITAGLL